MSQYTINDSCSNITNSFNVLSCTVTDDRSQLLTWLSPLEPRLRHRDIQERRVENVGEWLPQSEEFRGWYDRSEKGEGEGGKAVLFCHGDPGAGKTFISSLVVDRLCDRVGGQNAAVTCFYFDFTARKEQTAASMLGSLLKQIVSGMERIPEEISEAFERQKNAIGGRGPQLPEIVKMLQTTISSRPTFICIDALDECAGVHRAKILTSLKQILEKSPGTRIFLTGRPHIWAEIENRLPGRVMRVSVGPRKDDIIRYLRARLDDDETPDAMDESLEADILQEIPENVSEMFLLVSLNIEAILQEPTIYQRREKLGRMTDGLGLEAAYGATIERIQAQGGGKARLGMAALMWMSHAEEPLQPNELCYALAVELGSTDFNAGNVASISTLVSCCQGLITVDKEESDVRLIHITLQEYLSTHPDIFTRPHSVMAETCLTYLNSQHVKALQSVPYRDIPDTPFLEYSSVYWGVHAKRDLSDCAKSLALRLSQADHVYIPTAMLLDEPEHLNPAHHNPPDRLSGLLCASFFGIVEVVAALIETDCWGTSEGDIWGCSPLGCAARNGHEEVIKILLERGETDPNSRDYDGQTPLSLAAQNGHVGAVKLLLGRKDVAPDTADNYGDTPLSLAAEHGYEEVVNELLAQEDVNPDGPTGCFFTPLWQAAAEGHEGVVKILLGREEVNPDKPDNYGRTPLHAAACAGHEEVVKILLGRAEVNPGKPEKNGRTPLLSASRAGHAGVVKMLLAREEVSLNEPDEAGQTPLSHAVWASHEEVVKILLGRAEVNPDKPDQKGRTPLSLAAWVGHAGVVKMLLARAEVNPDRPDKKGRTPLFHAADRGHAGVVNILLERRDVNPNKPDNNGWVPLSYAAMNDHEEVVSLLLSHKIVPLPGCGA